MAALPCDGITAAGKRTSGSFVPVAVLLKSRPLAATRLIGDRMTIRSCCARCAARAQERRLNRTMLWPSGAEQSVCLLARRAGHDRSVVLLQDGLEFFLHLLR